MQLKCAVTLVVFLKCTARYVSLQVIELRSRPAGLLATAAASSSPLLLRDSESHPVTPSSIASDSPGAVRNASKTASATVSRPLKAPYDSESASAWPKVARQTSPSVIASGSSSGDLSLPPTEIKRRLCVFNTTFSSKPAMASQWHTAIEKLLRLVTRSEEAITEVSLGVEHWFMPLAVVPLAGDSDSAELELATGSGTGSAATGSAAADSAVPVPVVPTMIQSGMMILLGDMLVDMLCE